MKTPKSHSGFILAFFITILVFLYPLIFMRSAFLSGDSFVQFFPWLKHYSASIKNFHFPFWVRYMQSGFPLMAEGQVGGFYPLNILTFFLLPFKAAYNCSVISHFIMGGIFTYLYARRLKADQAGGYLAALLFCFGSAYAGCFYNIVTLRTLAWFPLVLLLFELYLDKRGFKYIIFAGIVLGFQLLAGFIQMALYSALFYAIYFVYRSKLEKVNLRKILFALAIFLLLSFFISLPQIMLTSQLAKFSSREGATLGFVLWRSFPPFGLLGLVFPYLMLSINSHFYIGIPSLLFAVFCFFRLRQDPLLRGVVLIFLLSIFFALGKYNPIYTAAIKLTGFYAFRNPSKFLFFGAFALSVLAGCGLTRFFDSKEAGNNKKPFLVFRWVLFISGFLFLAAKLILQLFKRQIIQFGNWYVRMFIYNRPHHRYSLDSYLERIEPFYNDMISKFSFSDIFVISSWVFLITALFVLPIIFKKKLKQVVILIIFIDLFIFSFYGLGFRGNIKPFDKLMPDNPGLLKKLKADQELYRILPFDIKSQKLPNWSLPNANMTYGIDSIGCYTPLATKIYRDSLLDLEIVDDSLGLKSPETGAIREKSNILRLLNVKYIISHKRLYHSTLEMEGEENGIFLYKLKSYMSRFFFVKNLDKEIPTALKANIDIKRYDSGIAEIEIVTNTDGFLVFSEFNYPGWQVYVDGEKDRILPYSVIQAVKIKKGRHKVIFMYKPFVL